MRRRRRARKRTVKKAIRVKRIRTLDIMFRFYVS
nr:MAG TPA: hypothetical protein [Caudoviricetes sp.]